MWTLYNNKKDSLWEILDENNNIVAIVNQNNRDIKSKRNLSMILKAQELYNIVNKFKDINNNNYDKIIDESITLINSINDISNIEFSSSNKSKYPVAYIDLETDKLMYSLNAKLSDFLIFEEVGDNLGFLTFNIYSDDMFDVNRTLSNHIFSKEASNIVVNMLSEKFKYISDFITSFEESSMNNLVEYTASLIDSVCSEKFKRTLTLKEYLEEYPLLLAEDSLFVPTSIPNVLSNCSFTAHSEISIWINESEPIEGMLFYNKNDDRFYVYNLISEEFCFTSIDSTSNSLYNTKLIFVDYIQTNIS